MPPWGTRADLGPPSVPGAAQVGTWRSQGCGRSGQGGGLARAAWGGLSTRHGPVGRAPSCLSPSGLSEIGRASCRERVSSPV